MTIKQVQCLLTYLGYDPGGIDGLDGQKTRQAIRDFQTAENLGVDGVAGEQTAIRLKDAVWQDRFRAVPDSGQPPDLPDWWSKYKWFAPSEFRCPCGKCGGGIEKMHEGIVAEANALREYLHQSHQRRDQAFHCRRGSGLRGAGLESPARRGQAE